MRLNAVLGGIAVALFAISLFSYRASVTRAERFERGQKFLSQLNPDNIHQVEITKSGETVVLKKADDAYVVSSTHGYPAKNESINRFLRGILEISLEKEVGSSDSLAAELGVQPGGEESTEITLKDSSGKDMVHFLVGKSTDDGRGHYIRRLDGEAGPIYLSSRGVFLSSTSDSFLDKEILDVQEADIASIQGGDYLIEDESGTLTLKDIPGGKEAKSSELTSVKGAARSLRFEKVYLADDAAVAGLNFARTLTLNLKDKSGYAFALAQQDGKHYLQVEATFELDRVGISQEDTKEQLEEKSKILSRADEVTKFNNHHGSWVYEVTETVAGKFTKAKKDLIETPEKKDKS
ncbi:DUF4340 domain-containing protein [Sulfidibacter corallicola]|uniref:DUF4340 domain-containing protein n=1 Tax=Sulfidibacter corallicola TaxID=2818388 RepID=A0A8A4TTN0_SULCO|nr:DUF4340 domain-containing protein [Sulfidibacter corallicola]QTD53326.1 DUF4340 domain-containing protein [Sulfidibacter corallicola]